jgi:hypothetical protein
MGTKLGLHSEEFLHAVMHRQLLLSIACAVVLCASASLFLFADTANVHAAGAPSWWAFVVGAVAFPMALGVWYARRSGDIEDETLGLVDVGTLPPSVTARVHDEALRGD